MSCNWMILLGSLNWIVYLLSHRTLVPAGHEPSVLVPARLWVEHFLVRPPQAAFSPAVSIIGLHVSLKVSIGFT